MKLIERLQNARKEVFESEDYKYGFIHDIEAALFKAAQKGYKICVYELNKDEMMPDGVVKYFEDEGLTVQNDIEKTYIFRWY